ncbi:PEP/pyruvate-binding domain-containing protein [Microseira wollei]|uniref:Pyruvate phosphate dikinase, PEP/pyruvate-binding protein n=1 Tax=Microseira wollei NIES-4236 TaxID=2530354 RepID=A0AAV3XF20_9CYAN|nr:PEP/pyruvate-binding domain-containing protein [Microseira wollei]GET38022.1 pyruvate phosphate dikinase, PEP/pyruvate-binding protein [Microseira wollei NIES-4236]
MKYIIQLEDKEKASLMGGKARAIAQLQSEGFLIPNGFVVSAAAFEDSVNTQQKFDETSLQQYKAIQTGLVTVQPREAVQLELLQALAELCPNAELLAVRSSASDEDGMQHSFAGQFDSFLHVKPADVVDKIAAVWRSGFNIRVLNYRQELGLSPIPHPPAVLIQRMVNAEVSGVAFAADPVTGRRSIAVVSAVPGLASSLVSGENDADTYRVDREGSIIERQIIGEKPILKDNQILAVAELARQVSKYFQVPQDIEWAIESGQLYLLQSRPITALAQMPDPDGIFNLWDNSNIAESYSGVTTPLTFSFARRAYEEVYRQFCYFMGVPTDTINQHNDTFSRMIGLIQGRVYYNLLSWYRVLALLPGFKVNRRFMEQMLGLKESLPESIVSDLHAATWQNRLQDSWRLLMTVVGLIKNYFLLPRRRRKFYQRLAKALPPQFNIEALRTDELAAYYRHVERQLITRWDAPLINDFFAMIFYGVLRRMTEQWCKDKSLTLQNDLIGGEGGIISTEPAQRMLEMAGLISENIVFVNFLMDESLEVILSAMERVPQFKLQYQQYLEKFGDRCLEELKLESPTLHDDPLPLLRAVGQLAQVQTTEKQNNLPKENPLRKAAELKARRGLRSNPIRKLLFNWVLKNTRHRVRDRENLRFERTRVFGRARRVFVELGKRFYALNLIEDCRDIFYLEVEEILGYIEGTATCTDLQGLVGVRKAEFAKYREMPAPADRFETHGIVYQGLQFKNHLSPSPITDSYLQGIGCSPGLVRGSVRVISDPKQVVGEDKGEPLKPGTILVAERTDPGWILLFPAAAGLLVERGSLLSHAAIVARELGIPAIVSIPGVTQWLKDGDWVELDGSTGRVCKINVMGNG